MRLIDFLNLLLSCLTNTSISVLFVRFVFHSLFSICFNYNVEKKIVVAFLVVSFFFHGHLITI